MFICKYCLEQFEDEKLAYVLMPENRLQHPAADAFAMKFCSRAHLEAFLRKVSHQRQAYVLTRVSGSTRQTLPAAPPLALLNQLGKVS